jgi:hypothetical protein
MPRRSAGTRSTTPPVGPPVPASADTDVTDLPPSQVMVMVSLTCDDDTGVFFFRSGGRLYMRRVDLPS